MKIFQCVQGSREWLALRMGKPTASGFEHIVTPKGEKSKGQETYLRELVAELIMGRPLEGPTMPWMQRGKDMEHEAVEFYEFQRDIETVPVGFITNDAETIGASPDRLIGDKGLLEIKVPKAETHVGYLLFNDVSKKYKPQTQGQLLVTGREWLDIVSYHPEMPPAIVHVERDEKFLATLEAELNSFVYLLADKRAELAERNMLWKPPEQEESPDFVSDEDVNMILKAQAEANAPKEHVPHFMMELRAWEQTLGKVPFLEVLGSHGYDAIAQVPVTAFTAIQESLLLKAKDLRLVHEGGNR